MVATILAAVVALVALVAIAAVRGSHRQVAFSGQYREATRPWNGHWRRVRSVTFALSLGRDCLVPILPATDCDHLGYHDLGHELPWFDVVPLNRRTHAVVTVLRRGGLRAPVNFILRLAYGFWLAAWICALALGAQATGLTHGVPMPWALSAAVLVLWRSVEVTIGSLTLIGASRLAAARTRKVS